MEDPLQIILIVPGLLSLNIFTELKFTHDEGTFKQMKVLNRFFWPLFLLP